MFHLYLNFFCSKAKKKKVENTYICNFVHSRNLPPHFMHSWGLHAGCLFKVYLNVFLGTILLCMKYLVLVEIVQILRQNMPNMPIPSWIFLSGFLLHVVLLLKLLHSVKIWKIFLPLRFYVKSIPWQIWEFQKLTHNWFHVKYEPQEN